MFFILLETEVILILRNMQLEEQIKGIKHISLKLQVHYQLLNFVKMLTNTNVQMVRQPKTQK